MIPKSGGVLERNPITMECYRYCIITKTSETRQGNASTEYLYPVEMGRSVKSRYKQEL